MSIYGRSTTFRIEEVLDMKIVKGLRELAKNIKDQRVSGIGGKKNIKEIAISSPIHSDKKA